MKLSIKQRRVRVVAVGVGVFEKNAAQGPRDAPIFSPARFVFFAGKCRLISQKKVPPEQISNEDELMNNGSCVSTTELSENASMQPPTDFILVHSEPRGQDSNQVFFPQFCRRCCCLWRPLESVWQQYRRPHSGAVSSSQEASLPANGISIRVEFVFFKTQNIQSCLEK